MKGASPGTRAGASVAVVAHLFGLTPRRIQQLVAEGILPKAERGRYDTAACVQAYVSHLQAQLDEARKASANVGNAAAVLEQEKALHAQVTRQLAEMRLAREQGAVVSADVLERDLDRLLGGLRARIVALASRWADRFVGLKSTRETATELRALTRELLAALRRGSAGDAPEEPSEAEVAA